jgi:RNA polymerase sigma-70 factor, ECF subfamily
MISLQQRIQRRQDLSLVRKIKAGEHQAFRPLVERYQRKIYALARGLVGSHALADDVTQETFIKVFRNLGRFDENYPFFPWLRRIAVNTALTALHSAGMRKNVALDVEMPEEALIEKQVEQSELLEQVRKQVARLPEEQRLVFVLRSQQEMSYEEIAGLLDVSIGTVMSRLNRARNRLKNLLHEYV